MSLVLSRRSGQTVVVDGCATITVYASSNVRLKIDAPPHVHIRRGELVDKRKEDETDDTHEIRRP